MKVVYLDMRKYHALKNPGGNMGRISSNIRETLQNIIAAQGAATTGPYIPPTTGPVNVSGVYAPAGSVGTDVVRPNVSGAPTPVYSTPPAALPNYTVVQSPTGAGYVYAPTAALQAVSSAPAGATGVTVYGSGGVSSASLLPGGLGDVVSKLSDFINGTFKFMGKDVPVILALAGIGAAALIYITRKR
jgi:hypothetical protein